LGQRLDGKKPAQETCSPDTLAFDLFPDALEVNICKIIQIPFVFLLDFRSVTDLNLVGLELLSRSCRPATADPNRFDKLPSGLKTMTSFLSLQSPS